MPSLPCWIVTLLQCEPKIPASYQIFGHSQQEKQIIHLYPLQKQKESLHVSTCLANRSPDPFALVQLHLRRRALRNSGSFYWRLVFLWRKKIHFKEMSIAFNMPKQLWFLFLANKQIICQTKTHPSIQASIVWPSSHARKVYKDFCICS